MTPPSKPSCAGHRFPPEVIGHAVWPCSRFPPRHSEPKALARGRLRWLADRLNDTPRRCLGHRTPREVFEQHLATPPRPAHPNLTPASVALRVETANKVLLRRVAGLAEAVALERVEGGADKVRRFGEFAYAAETWHVERQVVARVEASDKGADSRFIVTNLPGLPKMLYEKVYCARGQADICQS